MDSNVTRDFRQAGEQPGALLSLVGGVEGRLAWEHGWLAGTYDAGARAFAGPPGQETLVQAASVEGGLQLHPQLQLSVEGLAKDRRGGRRAYSDLVGGGVLTLLPDARVEVRLRLAAHRFLYREYFPSSFGASEGGLRVRYRLDRQQSLTAGAELGARHFRDEARLPQAPRGREPGPRREDTVVGASVGYSFRGPFAFGVGYGYLGQQSNSYGETVVRHRVSTSAGLRLPWELTAMGQVTLQLLAFPDGVYLSPDVPLVFDDETQNSVSLKLARPLAPTLDVEARYAFYAGLLPTSALLYTRHVATVGFTWRP